MTVRLSAHKVAKIMRCYFSGLSQGEIAEKAGVDQSTVSLYACRLKTRAGEIGLSSAGKEFTVFNEVDSLRSLSVELSKADLTVEEAKQGLNIMKIFLKLGISPEEHTALVRACKEANEPGFIQAAVKLIKIENECNVTYGEAISRFDSATSFLPSLQKQVKDMESKLKSVNNSLAQRNQKLKDLESHLARLGNEAETKAAKIEQALTAKMKRLKVKQVEVEEMARLKSELSKRGLDIQTLIRLGKEFSDGTAKS